MAEQSTKPIGVEYGRWEYHHGPRFGGNFNLQRYVEEHRSHGKGTIFGRHWREEITFKDPNYHGN